MLTPDECKRVCVCDGVRVRVQRVGGAAGLSHGLRLVIMMMMIFLLWTRTSHRFRFVSNYSASLKNVLMMLNFSNDFFFVSVRP